LARHPRFRLSVVSGRRLSHIQDLLPVPGIWLAGVYGIELLSPQGETINRLDYREVRPVLEPLKSRWDRLIERKPGFYLEDKGWSLAIHARFAVGDQVQETLATARRMAEKIVDSPGFRQLEGDKFLEVCPMLADKGEAVEYILAIDPWPEAVLVTLGDDDKDARAFQVVQARGGIAIQVGSRQLPLEADCRLQTPEEVRQWLHKLGDNS
jgi:trehalose 6-phosphate phosphatase